MADTKDMFLETEISRPAEYISRLGHIFRLGKSISQLIVHTDQKQKVGMHLETNLSRL